MVVLFVKSNEDTGCCSHTNSQK